MKSHKNNIPTVEYLIVGGGPTGLGAAWQLHNHDQDWMLLEKEACCGGLSRSFKDEQGFTWDYGGHVLFSHYDTFEQYMEMALGESGWLQHQRESWIWLRDRFIPYPFQRNLHRLDPDDRWFCVRGLLDCWKRSQGQPRKGWSSFREWILETFGAGVAELFLLPYNYKVWAWPPETMDHSWIGERVAVPKLEEILHSVCTGQDDVSWGPNNTFRFPEKGGTGAIWSSLADLLPPGRILYNESLSELDVDKHVVTTRSGKRYGYRKLISTIALDELVGMSGYQDATVNGFHCSSTHIVGVGVNGQPPEHLKTKCWMYFPELESPYYRITVFSNYSPNNVARPSEQWSLMAEVSESPCKPVEASALAEDVVDAFVRDDLLSRNDVISSIAYRCLPKAYPTPFLGRDDMINPLLRELELNDVYSRGRFGAWKYEVANMDHSFMQGWECGARLIAGGDDDMEPTLHRPTYVNSRRNA